jgi:hypothetical protein
MRVGGFICRLRKSRSKNRSVQEELRCPQHCHEQGLERRQGRIRNPAKCHRACTRCSLGNFVKTLLKGPLVRLEGETRWRTAEEDVEGKPFKRIIVEIHASCMMRSRKLKPLTISPSQSNAIIPVRKSLEFNIVQEQSDRPYAIIRFHEPALYRNRSV